VAEAPTNWLERGLGWFVAQAVNFLFLVVLWPLPAMGLRAAGVEWANALGFGFLASFFWRVHVQAAHHPIAWQKSRGPGAGI
jgi:hypothetical protein